MTPFLAFTLPCKMLGISCRALNELLYHVEAWHSCKLRNFVQAVVGSKPFQFFKLFKLRAAVIRQFHIIETAQVCEF